MNIEQIFLLQFVTSVIVFALLAKWVVSPWLTNMTLELTLVALLIPHTFRHIGMTFLVPTLNQPDMPMGFATAAAYGDLISGFLALGSILALKIRWSLAIPLVWIFNLVGVIDLVNALRQDEAISYMGATWFIPTFLVPLLLVTHYMIFSRLIMHARKPQLLGPT